MIIFTVNAFFQDHGLKARFKILDHSPISLTKIDMKLVLTDFN
jgi:hypothetical protein